MVLGTKMKEDKLLPLPLPGTPILDLGWFYLGRDLAGNFHFHINGICYDESEVKSKFPSAPPIEERK